VQGRRVNERERRLGENEVLYREVNERVRELHVGFGFDAQLIEFVCECARVECTERIRLSQAEYERVRADEALFVIVPGHPTRGTETDLRGDGWVCVLK
jgi:hypothetical protein